MNFLLSCYEIWKTISTFGLNLVLACLRISLPAAPSAGRMTISYMQVAVPAVRCGRPISLLLWRFVVWPLFTRENIGFVSSASTRARIFCIWDTVSNHFDWFYYDVSERQVLKCVWWQPWRRLLLYIWSLSFVAQKVRQASAELLLRHNQALSVFQL